MQCLYLAKYLVQMVLDCTNTQNLVPWYYNLETGHNCYFRVMLIDFAQYPNTLFRI